jgi:plastocyanin
MWSPPRFLVLVPLALGLGACGDTSPPADASAGTTITCTADGDGDVAVAIQDFMFDPAGAEVQAGQSVTWTNGDDAPHSVWSEARTQGAREWESVGPDPAATLPEALPKGATSTCTFPEAGTYAYVCGIHNTMRGTVTVR